MVGLGKRAKCLQVEEEITHLSVWEEVDKGLHGGSTDREMESGVECVCERDQASRT